MKTHLSLVCLFSLGLLVTFTGSPVQGQEIVTDAETVDEEIFELAEFEVVERNSDQWTLAKILGHLHPAVIHMPIAWLMLLFLIEFVNLTLHQTWLNRPGYYLLILTTCSFAPALITGFVNLSQQTSINPIALQHRNTAITCLILCALALAIRVRQKTHLKNTIAWIYLIVIFTAVALVGLTGHLGGKLVFGENYLPF